MNGEQLYNKWRFCMADEGVEVDPWEFITERTKNAWTSLAEDLNTEET